MTVAVGVVDLDFERSSSERGTRNFESASHRSRDRESALLGPASLEAHLIRMLARAWFPAAQLGQQIAISRIGCGVGIVLRNVQSPEMRQIDRTPTSLYAGDKASLEKTMEHFTKVKA